MKKSLCVLMCTAMAVVASLSMFACSEKTFKATACADGDSNGVAIATVEVNKKGEILDVVIDELFAPTSIGYAAAKGATVSEPTVEGKVGHDSGLFYEYIVIDGKTFKAAVTDGNVSYSGIGDSVAIGDVVAYVKTDAGREFYHNAYVVKKLFAGKLDGEKVVATASALKGNAGAVNKMSSTYWDVKDGLGFKGNIAELEKHFELNGFAGADAPVITDKKVVINGITTGATLTNVPVYCNAAKAAYDLAMAACKA